MLHTGQFVGAWVQGGISTADRIVTVSPGYAWEIQTPEGGWGMELMLTSRAYALNGILNGIDTQEWNPSTDKHIVKNYSISNFTRGKVTLHPLLCMKKCGRLAQDDLQEYL